MNLDAITVQAFNLGLTYLDEGVNKWSQLVQRVITWLSLRNVLGAVIQVE